MYKQTNYNLKDMKQKLKCTWIHTNTNKIIIQSIKTQAKNKTKMSSSLLIGECKLTNEEEIDKQKFVVGKYRNNCGSYICKGQSPIVKSLKMGYQESLRVATPGRNENFIKEYYNSMMKNFSVQHQTCEQNSNYKQ